MSQGFNQIAQQLWNDGRQTDAIQHVVIALNAHKNLKKPKPLLIQFSYYLFLMSDYKAASQVFEEAAKHYPNDLDIKSNWVVSLSRNQKYEKAIEVAESIVSSNPKQYIVWDALAKCYSKTQQFESALNAGNQALQIKDQQFSRDINDWSLPKQSIDSFLLAKKNVIAFSLWGKQERYINGAIRNLLLRQDFYPSWEVWIYIDNTVPETIQATLRKLGAVLHQQAFDQPLLQKLCWRFQVANHPDVGRFLVRDIDSVFSLRESLAVHEWEQSDYWFHTIHDWWTHTDLILAGLWGGIANVLPNVWAQVESYQGSSLPTPNIDQWFLRDQLWSYVKLNCLMHDRFYRKESTKIIPGPNPKSNQHIGSCEFSQNAKQQRLLVSAWLK